MSGGFAEGAVCLTPPPPSSIIGAQTLPPRPHNTLLGGFEAPLPLALAAALLLVPGPQVNQPDQYVFRVYTPLGVQPLPYVLLETAGDVGRFNRAQMCGPLRAAASPFCRPSNPIEPPPPLLLCFPTFLPHPGSLAWASTGQSRLQQRGGGQSEARCPTGKLP